jgi:hypothetical protein
VKIRELVERLQKENPEAEATLYNGRSKAMASPVTGLSRVPLAEDDNGHAVMIEGE